MAYLYFGDKALGAPLGPVTWNQAWDNARDVLALQRAQHDPAGDHNALEIPRGIIGLNWNGSSYVTHGLAGKASSPGVTPLGTGELRLEWGGGASFSTPAAYSVAVRSALAESDPCLAEAYAVQQDQVEIRLARRTGSPNTWAAADMSFCLAIFCRPFTPVGSFPAVPTTNIGREYPLGAESWNTMVQPNHDLRTMLDARHSLADGTHDDSAVARCAFRVQWSGAYYSGTHLNGGAAPAIVRNGAGDVTVSFDGSAAAKHVWVTPDYARAAGGLVTDIHRGAAPQTRDANGSIRVFLWKWSGSAWALADTDFTAHIFW